MNVIETIGSVSYTQAYWVILLPLIFAGADIVTGWIQAQTNATWDSTKLRKGLYRKGGEIGVVCLALIAERALDVVAACHVSTFASLYIVITEAVSVFENLDQAGVVIPSAIRGRLLKVRKGMEADEGVDKEEKTGDEADS